MADEFWDDGRIKRLTMLWRDHGWPSGEIATVLGCSRSAVLGKVARLKLTRYLATGAAGPGLARRGPPARESSPAMPVVVRPGRIAVPGPAPIRRLPPPAPACRPGSRPSRTGAIRLWILGGTSAAGCWAVRSTRRFCSVATRRPPASRTVPGIARSPMSGQESRPGTPRSSRGLNSSWKSSVFSRRNSGTSRSACDAACRSALGSEQGRVLRRPPADDRLAGAGTTSALQNVREARTGEPRQRNEAGETSPPRWSGRPFSEGSRLRPPHLTSVGHLLTHEGVEALPQPMRPSPPLVGPGSNGRRTPRRWRSGRDRV